MPAGVSPDTGTLRGDLVAVVTGMADTLASEDGALVAGVLRAMRTDTELAGLVQAQMLSGMRDGFGVILERAVRRGSSPRWSTPTWPTRPCPRW